MKRNGSLLLCHKLPATIVAFGALAAAVTAAFVFNGLRGASLWALDGNLLRHTGVPVTLAAFAFTAFGYLLSRTITEPLKQLAEAMARIASRNYEGEIPATERGDEIGAVATSLALLRDRLAEQEATGARQAAIIEAVTGGLQVMIEFDREGTILDANQNYLDVVGYDIDEIVGRHHSILEDSDRAGTAEYRGMWERLGTGEPCRGTFRRLAKGGRVVFLQGSYSPLRDEAGEVVRVVKVASDVTKAETERLEDIEHRKAMENENSRVVDELGRSLNLLAEGDLTVRIKEPFASEYETLRTNFNAATEKLEEALTSVMAAAASIRDESSQVSLAADDLSRRTENQAAALEETAASLEELTSSVMAAVEGAERANSDVDATRRNAEESGRIVRDAVKTMSEIEKSSDHISKIISVIDDIAFQTNLLALNAGVEAARAGDAGRGFAVVASEVRALAQRSSDAAKEIKALISTSSQHVGRGVELVRETGRSLETIVEAVGGIAALVSELANSSREQSVGLTEINTAVSQLDQVTQQNAAMVEQSTAASHSMKAEAVSLARLVAQFKASRSEPTAKRGSIGPAEEMAGREPGPRPVSKELTATWAKGATALSLERDPLDDWKDF